MLFFINTAAKKYVKLHIMCCIMFQSYTKRIKMVETKLEPHYGIVSEIIYLINRSEVLFSNRRTSQILGFTCKLYLYYNAVLIIGVQNI